MLIKKVDGYISGTTLEYHRATIMWCSILHQRSSKCQLRATWMEIEMAVIPIRRTTKYSLKQIADLAT